MEFWGTPSYDQLGRGGRTRNPRFQHYSAEAIELIEGAGGPAVHFPPYGECLNPVELLFNELKQHPLRRQPLPQTRASFKAVINDYMEYVAPAHLAGFFREAANGSS